MVVKTTVTSFSLPLVIESALQTEKGMSTYLSDLSQEQTPEVERSQSFIGPIGSVSLTSLIRVKSLQYQRKTVFIDE